MSFRIFLRFARDATWFTDLGIVVCFCGRQRKRQLWLFNLLNVALVDDGEVVEVAFLLLGLLRQDVAVISVFSLDFSCTGKGEPLFGTGISLNLGHCLFFVI